MRWIIGSTGRSDQGRRRVMPANLITREFDETSDSDNRQFDFVLFLDGHERQGALESTAAEFRRSWRRPKWHILVRPDGRPDSVTGASRSPARAPGGRQP